MSLISEQVAYLNGLAEGMHFTEDDPKEKLLLKMLEVFELIANELEEVNESISEADDYYEYLDDRITGLEGEDDEVCCPADCDSCLRFNEEVEEPQEDTSEEE